ncbi:MAG: HigA family addiction module antitoxin [Pseudolabrys sp.]|nr:HigA family addiction module antitoxin [Pseudolabrys sp.]
MSADIPAKAMAPGGVSPGEHLRMEIRRLALDQVAVGRATGVSRQSINNIINGRQAVSRAMAIKLGRLTGHSADYWLRASFPTGADDRYPAGSDKRLGGAGVLVNHQIAQAVKRGIIVIEPFHSGLIRAASIDQRSRRTRT